MLNFKKFKRCIIVAEISANHGQDFSKAVSLIRKAKEYGADAVKFQLYNPDSLTIDVNNKYFKIKHPKWGGQTLYQLYKKAYTPWHWFVKLKKIADDLGIIFFATAFDKRGVDLLEEIGISLHKIASFELTDLPLIEYMAKTKKPLILSTGMATLQEIGEAVNTARKGGVRNIVLLKCVSAYPADPADMNLKTIADLRDSFHLPVGISDHSLGTVVSVVSVSLGAMMVEKHFTLSRKNNTADSFFSIEPQELKELVNNVRIAEQSLGKIYYGLTKEEKTNVMFRRSLFVVKDIRRGDIFTEENVKSIRPAFGVLPKHLSDILGKRAKKDILRGMPLKWDLIKR